MLTFPTCLRVSDRRIVNQLKGYVRVFGWIIHGRGSTHQHQLCASSPYSLSTLQFRRNVRVVYVSFLQILSFLRRCVNFLIPVKIHDTS